MESNKKPTEVYDEPFVYHYKDEIALKYLFDVEEAGKWMMFIEKSELDKKWEEVCKIYDSGVLTGIRALKCSTSYKNPRASDWSTGVIILYCGPASDQEKVMEYGENILKHIKYENSGGFMYYKTDAQTYAGTRATGQKKNSTYRIPVPRPTSSENFYKRMSKLSIQPTRKSSDNKPNNSST